MAYFTLSVPLPDDFDWDEHWLSVAGALNYAAQADVSFFGVAEVDLGASRQQVLRVNLDVETQADGWLAARRLEDGLRDHGVEWAGASQLHGEDEHG